HLILSPSMAVLAFLDPGQELQHADLTGNDRNPPTVPMIAFAVPSLRYRAVASGRRDRAGIGSSTSHRIIAISCAKLGLD
ncbi:hypothetical protein, partial [Nonomuraea basaltis]|uniref:hypothetical protein n=1 Tax=Nonomuraea basaltis TaxID=2495887 RepID=UPI00197F822A